MRVAADDPGAIPEKGARPDLGGGAPRRSFTELVKLVPDGVDPDDFDGWAIWSGTSFSAPVVVGNLARMMMADSSSTAAAIRRLIDATSLTSIPYLGTVVDAM